MKNFLVGPDGTVYVVPDGPIRLVTFNPDGTFACSCPAWVKARASCKHVRAAERAMKGEQCQGTSPQKSDTNSKAK